MHRTLTRGGDDVPWLSQWAKKFMLTASYETLLFVTQVAPI